MSFPSHSPQPNTTRRTPKKKGISGLAIFLIVAGALGFCFLLAVGGLVFFISQAGNDSDEMMTVVANDRLSQLDVPSNWKPITGADRNMEASLQYGNMLGEKYAMVLSEPKSELYQVVGDDFSLDDFTALVSEGMEEQNFQIGSKQNITVDGLPGRRVRMTTSMEGLSIVYMVTLLEGKVNFHQVHAWTLTSREKKNMPVLIKVSDTFKEK